MNTIGQHWELFSNVPSEIPEAQRKEMRFAFYAGAEAVLRISWNLGSDDALSDDDAMKLFNALHAECLGFRQERFEESEASL